MTPRTTPTSSTRGDSQAKSSSTSSTIGTKYDNKQCSPYEVSWHVDRDCCDLSAKVLDETCRQMEELGMEADLEPHGSRELVSKELAAKEAA